MRPDGISNDKMLDSALAMTPAILAGLTTLAWFLFRALVIFANHSVKESGDVFQSQGDHPRSAIRAMGHDWDLIIKSIPDSLANRHIEVKPFDTLDLKMQHAIGGDDILGFDPAVLNPTTGKTDETEPHKLRGELSLTPGTLLPGIHEVNDEQ